MLNLKENSGNAGKVFGVGNTVLSTVIQVRPSKFLAVDTAIESQFQVRPEVAEAKTWRTSCHLSLLLYLFDFILKIWLPQNYNSMEFYFCLVKSRFLPLVLYKRRSEVNERSFIKNEKNAKYRFAVLNIWPLKYLAFFFRDKHSNIQIDIIMKNKDNNVLFLQVSCVYFWTVTISCRIVSGIS